MLESAFRVVQQQDRLVVSAPPTSLFASWLALGIYIGILLFFLLVLRHIKQLLGEIDAFLYKVFGAVVILGPLFFLAIGYNSGSIILDRASNRATVRARMMLFLPAQAKSIDLSSVTNATLDGKPNARRIRLETAHGSDLSYPIWSDRSGQKEAVIAINNFLKER